MTHGSRKNKTKNKIKTQEQTRNELNDVGFYIGNRLSIPKNTKQYKELKNKYLKYKIKERFETEKQTKFGDRLLNMNQKMSEK